MGLFETVLHDAPAAAASPAPSPEEAYVTVLVGAAACDGVVSPVEVARLNDIFRSTRLLNGGPDVALQPLVSRVMAEMEAHGAGPVVALAATAVPEKLRAPAFAAAVDLVLADGQAVPAERRFIDELQRLLQIGDEVALRIVDVMLVKNSA